MMTISEITKAANAYTDENFRQSELLFFINEAIGVINAELNSSLPFLTSDDDAYYALSETWIRQVIVPYVCYSIKMNDGSLDEASMFIRSFELGLTRLVNNKIAAIPTEYQNSDFSQAYQIDYVSGLQNTFAFESAPVIIKAYDPYAAYYEGSFVSYNGLTYISIKDTKGNMPTNTDYWRPYN